VRDHFKSIALEMIDALAIAIPVDELAQRMENEVELCAQQQQSSERHQSTRAQLFEEDSMPNISTSANTSDGTEAVKEGKDPGEAQLGPSSSAYANEKDFDGNIYVYGIGEERARDNTNTDMFSTAVIDGESDSNEALSHSNSHQSLGLGEADDEGDNNTDENNKGDNTTASTAASSLTMSNDSSSISSLEDR
jgi:hypothetical protein